MFIPGAGYIIEKLFNYYCFYKCIYEKILVIVGCFFVLVIC